MTTRMRWATLSASGATSEGELPAASVAEAAADDVLLLLRSAFGVPAVHERLVQQLVLEQLFESGERGHERLGLAGGHDKNDIASEVVRNKK